MKFGTKVNSRSLISNLLSIFENVVTLCRYVALKVEHIANICRIDTDHQNGSKLQENLLWTQCDAPEFESAVTF